MKHSFNFYLKLFNEFIGIPVALLLYFITPVIIRMIDPEAGAFDPGQLAIISFAVIKLIVASFVAWLGFRLNFPKMYNYFIHQMETDLIIAQQDDFNSNNKLKCVAISLSVYFFYMLLVIICLQTV